MACWALNHPTPLPGVAVAFEFIRMLRLDLLCGVFCGAHVFIDFSDTVLEMTFGFSIYVPN